MSLSASSHYAELNISASKMTCLLVLPKPIRWFRRSLVVTCMAVAFIRSNNTNFCVILFIQTWSGHQMTCEGTPIVWQWRDRSKSCFPINSNLPCNSEILLSHYKRKVWFTQHGISASLLLVSPSIWCDALHDRVWHLSRLVPWKVSVLAALPFG